MQPENVPLFKCKILYHKQSLSYINAVNVIKIFNLNIDANFINYNP